MSHRRVVDHNADGTVRVTEVADVGDPTRRDESLSAGGAHLTTLEHVRELVQSRLDSAKADRTRENAAGVYSEFGDGYIHALGHVLSMVAAVRDAR